MPLAAPWPQYVKIRIDLMISMKLSKLLPIAVISAALFASCAKVKTGDIANLTPSDLAKTVSPFPNKEPENYQTEIWQTSATGTEKFFIVRSGKKWRFDSSLGEAEQVTDLHTDKEYVLLYATKVFAEYSVAHGFDEREGTVNEISLGMLNSDAKGIYEKLGTDAGVTKYKVISDADKGRESVVSFDEKLGLPVRKEIYKGTGTERTLEMTVTLSGFKTDVEETLFALPKDFKKVSIEEMKKALSDLK